MKKFKKLQVVFSIIVFLMLVSALSYPGYALEANMVSNVDGKIRVVLLHYGEMGFGGLWFDMTIFFRHLMDKMDKDVGFVVIVGNDGKVDVVKEALKPYEAQKLPDGTARVKYLPVEVKTSQFYPYARDAYLIQTDKDNNLIFLDSGYNFAPFPILNFDDVFAGAKIRAGMFNRGGGNIRTTDKEIIIGMDTFLGVDATRRHGFLKDTFYTMAKNKKKEDTALLKKRLIAHAEVINHALAPAKKMVIPGLDYFFEEFAKGEFKFTRKIVHSTGSQAAYHTDVYLGLGHVDKKGRRVLFIADSAAGAKVVKKMPDAERREVERGLYKGLAAEGVTAVGIPVTEEQVAKRLRWEHYKLLDLSLEKTKKTTEVLDRTAKHLETLGYRVVRIPYLPNGLHDSKERHDIMFGMGFNYSNVLTEVYDNVKKVYIPRYGFKQLDEAAARAYREAGFRVVILDGPLSTAITPRNDGAGLDCLTSEIRVPVRWAKKYYAPEKK
ncbi:MAG: hypothetical protein KAW12_04030 [Candidatus Aminicenantes bacterium]|nr:hypothetical protein [Candidatus Aminicenantes bacterium]